MDAIVNDPIHGLRYTDMDTPYQPFPKLSQGIKDPGFQHTLLPPTSEGTKADDGKLRYDLIPPDALDEVARVLTFGAKKYGDRNWEKGMLWGRLFGALMRHAWAWGRGEDKDPETGLSHMAHATSCALMLLAYVKRNEGADRDNNDNRKHL